MKIWTELFCSSRYPACLFLMCHAPEGASIKHQILVAPYSILEMLMSKLEWSSSTCHSSRLLIEWISSIGTRTVYFMRVMLQHQLHPESWTTIHVHTTTNAHSVWYAIRLCWEMYWRAYIDQMTKLKWSEIEWDRNRVALCCAALLKCKCLSLPFVRCTPTKEKRELAGV